MPGRYTVTVVVLDWQELFTRLESQLEVIQNWVPEEPKPDALRCEHSKHRTLAHLRACQQQWLAVVTSFMERDSPSIRILHPWRRFDSEGYASLDWDIHMQKFVKDRKTWLALKDVADPNRGGKWNGKADTILGLTARLADHESLHLSNCP